MATMAESGAGASLAGYARYAVYWAPAPGSALAEAGAAWLGRDPATGWEDPARADDSRVAAPRRYGFHATLKPPFRLAEGTTPEALDHAVAALAARLAPAGAPGLAVDDGLGFLALRPQGPCRAIDAVARACVAELDRFRAPLDEAERARRLAGRPLTARQRALLERWGYPYVMEEFRFHVTLTGPEGRAAATAEEVRRRLAPHLGPAFTLDRLALFGDPGGGAGFRLLRHHPLSG